MVPGFGLRWLCILIAGKIYNKWYLNSLKVTFLFNLILLDTFEMADKETAVVIIIVLLLHSWVLSCITLH